jgi:hypothetical protein
LPTDVFSNERLLSSRNITGSSPREMLPDHHEGKVI